MPLYGLVHDSPFIYAAQKAMHSTAKGFSVSTSSRFSWQFEKLRIYDMVLSRELKSPNLMVGRHLRAVGDRVAHRARMQVGKKTGSLARAIKVGPQKSFGYGQRIMVGAKHKIAYMHHEGTKPHLIAPKRAGGSLVFMKGGRVIVTKLVMHPGTKPNRYLSDQLNRGALGDLA